MHPYARNQRGHLSTWNSKINKSMRGSSVIKYICKNRNCVFSVCHRLSTCTRFAGGNDVTFGLPWQPLCLPGEPFGTAARPAPSFSAGPWCYRPEALSKMTRGPKKHMKRLNAPHHWMLDKLGGIFVRSQLVWVQLAFPALACMGAPGGRSQGLGLAAPLARRRGAAAVAARLDR